MPDNLQPPQSDDAVTAEQSAGSSATSTASSILNKLQNFNIADFVKGKPGQWQKAGVVAVIVIIVMGLGAIMMWGLALWALANSFGDPSGSRCATGEECFLKDNVFSNTTTITNADWVLERIKPHKPNKERIQQIIDESRRAGINPAILISFWAGEQTFANEEKAFGCGDFNVGGDDRGFENQLKCAIPTIKDAINNTGEYTDPEGENIWTRLIYNYVAAARKQLYDEEGYVTGSSESRISILKKLEPSKGSWVECASNTQCNISGGCQIGGPDIKQAVRHEKRTFTVTAYCPPATGYDRIEGGQTTASGINVGIGAVAVPPFNRPNPNISGSTPDYPWGTTFVIPGYGTGVALDHGCAIQKAGVADSCRSSNWPVTRNDHIDLFVGNGKQACADWEKNNPSTLEVDVYWFDQSRSSPYYYKKVNSFINRNCLATGSSNIDFRNVGPNLGQLDSVGIWKSITEVMNAVGKPGENIIQYTFMGKNISGGINKALKGPLDKVQADIKASGANYNFSSIGGTKVRENTNRQGRISPHSFGTAIDINPTQNPNIKRKEIAGSDPRETSSCPKDIPKEVSDAFEKNGFFWGAKFYCTCDAMHFQYGGNYDTSQVAWPYPPLKILPADTSTGCP